MSGFIYSEFVQNYFMSRIYPVFSAHKKFRTVNLTILPDIFQIFSKPHGQILDIFDDIFWIFLFHRNIVVFRLYYLDYIVIFRLYYLDHMMVSRLYYLDHMVIIRLHGGI
jgi:hypothetical protein